MWKIELSFLLISISLLSFAWIIQYENEYNVVVSFFYVCFECVPLFLYVSQNNLCNHCYCTYISQWDRWSSNFSVLLKMLSQSLHCFFQNNHLKFMAHLPWSCIHYPDIWQNGVCVLFITFSLSKTVLQTSQAAGKWSKFILEWSLDMVNSIW